MLQFISVNVFRLLSKFYQVFYLDFAESALTSACHCLKLPVTFRRRETSTQENSIAIQSVNSGQSVLIDVMRATV